MRSALALLLCLGACAEPPAPPPPSPPTAPIEEKTAAPSPVARLDVAPDSLKGAAVDVVIVGGGLAGLVSAYHLERRGLTTRILEAGTVLGGRVATADYGNGVVAELGMQELWEPNPLVQLARDLGVALEEPDVAYSSVLMGGKVHPFVQETAEEYLRATFGPEELAAHARFFARALQLHQAALKDGLKNAEVAGLQNLTFKEWLEREQLPPRVAEWIRLTTECEVGADWELFSALFGLLELEVFLEGGKANYHVEGGNSRLIEAIAKRVRGEKTLGAMVTGITREERGGELRVRVAYFKDNRVGVAEGKRVVVAVPFTRLHQLDIEPPLPPAYWEAINTLGMGQYTVVHYLVDRSAVAPTLVSGESPFPILSNGPLGVIYGVNEVAPRTQPLEVFSLLVYGAQARAFHMAPRDTKLRQLLGEIDALWPGFSAKVKSAHVYSYHPAAIPFWPRGRSPLDSKSELLRTPVLGLHLAGDYLFNAHSDGAARSAMHVAVGIGSELGK